MVENWYDRNSCDISYDTRLLYLIDLFQELKENGLHKKDLPDVGDRIVNLLDMDFIDESMHMIYQRVVAEEIACAYRTVLKDLKEIKDTESDVEQVRIIEDDDIYQNNTSEPDIDLRGVDLGPVKFDEEFIKELGINNE